MAWRGTALGSVLRTMTDNGFLRLDHSFSQKETISSGISLMMKLLNQSPLNDGFDLLPLSRTISIAINPSPHARFRIKPSMVNELRMQFARRSFDFQRSPPAALELSNTFTTALTVVIRFLPESRFELVDDFSISHDRTPSASGKYKLRSHNGIVSTFLSL